MHRAPAVPKAPATMSAAVSALKPPKAPCWRDFVAPQGGGGPHSEGGGGGEVGASKLGGAKQALGGQDFADSGGRGGSPSGSKSAGKSSKRVRARLHRTRSEHLIQADELPEDALTVSLAETRPREFGLGRQFMDERLYLEENTRRCQSWLASIEACEPLDTIAYTGAQAEPPPGSPLPAPVDVEVPEESPRWTEEGAEELRPPFNTSASSSEGDGSPETGDLPASSSHTLTPKLPSPPHSAELRLPGFHPSELPPSPLGLTGVTPGLGLAGVGAGEQELTSLSTAELERQGLLRLASAHDANRKLCRDKMFPLPESSGLE